MRERRNPALGAPGESGAVSLGLSADDQEGIGKQRLLESLQEKVDQYLFKCMEQETPPRVFELARLLKMSRNRLTDIFRRALGISLSRYLKWKQVETAKQLLITTNLSVDKIAYLVGFGTRRTLFRTFLRTVARTPTQYRCAVRNVSRQEVRALVKLPLARPQHLTRGNPDRS
jgi:transcriptional regulator GlxA family with amidase domain